tara:strand:- start:2794 stop:3285 length:492 start_codon:yes stop_codon:yes gene_type:complete
MTTTTNFNFNLPSVGGDANAWGTKLNTNWTNLDAILNGTGTDIVINGLTANGLTLTGVVSIDIDGAITEEVHSAGASGTINITATNGTIQTIAMTGNVTITDGLSSGQFVTLQISSVGSDTVTWPTMEWVYGSAPSLHATSDNWVQLWKVGSTLYGSFVGFSS